jgi:putative ABC transport system permease protein
VRRDVTAGRGRSALVVLSIAVGVCCVGMVLGARSTIVTAMNQQFRVANPANATLITDSFGGFELRSVRHVPGVTDAEARYAVDTRIETGSGTWKDLLLFGIPDFNHMRISRVLRQQGAWPPPPGTMLLERTSFSLLGERVGSRVTLETPSGLRRDVTISGTGHDLNQPASTVSGLNYGYATFATLASLGQGRAFNQLYIRVSGDQLDTAHIWSIAEAVRTVLERGGRRVQIVVPEPGRLWVYDAVESMLLLMTIPGVAALAMSGFLMVNIVTAQIAVQTRQIGIMKAIGARPRQIGALYMANVGVLALLALCVGVPLGIVGAIALVGYATGLLDFDAAGMGLSPGTLGLEVLAGIGIPLLAALVPVLRASRITVREAITSYGMNSAGGTWVGRSLARIRRLPGAVVLGLGNTFRRKGRLAMTLIAMIVGGAVFISVLSVRASLLRTLDEVFGYRNYDVQVSFNHAYPSGRVARVAGRVPGVVRVEGWGAAAGERSGVSGLAAETISIVAPPAGSGLIKPVILHGRWLRTGDGRALAINSDLLADEPDLRVGAHVRYRVDGHPSTWTIVGIVRGVQEGPIAYVTYPALAAVTGQHATVNRLVAVTARHDATSASATLRALETHLERAGFAVEGADTTQDQRANLGANFAILVGFLLIMSILLAVVAGLGLMGTMVLNVLDRSREIGIMRAVGASNRDLVQVVVAEGFVIAVISWVVAIALALLLAPALTAAVGALFIRAPLAYTFSAGGTLIWLAGALLIAVLASLTPAWHACRLSVRDVLAYE